MKDNRDALDFGTMNVLRLFVKLFIPTLMGLIFSAILNLADGIFVGKGVGSDALASVNVAAPIFLVSTGIALLFATGVSIVAAVHLAQGKMKAASINVTQAFTVSAFILLLFSLAIFFFPSQLCYLFGGTAKLGMSTFIGETAIVCMLIVGNFVFVKYLHEDGVAAYSVACYLFPLVFMFGNSIAQSSLPIVSYNYGQKNEERIRKAFRLTVGLAVVLGLVVTIFCLIESDTLISLFLNEGTVAYQIGCKGFPYFTLGFLFFTLNVVFIGFYQSIEQAKRATLWMLLRGVIFVIPCFILLPIMLGDKELWLAVPLSEMLTFVVILLSLVRDRMKNGLL